MATERDILRLRAKGGDERTLVAREAMRAESASALERKMAAMQAVMAARRTVLVEAEAAAAPPVSKAEQMMEAFKPPAMISQAVGGAGSGNGYEILFQVGSCTSTYLAIPHYSGVHPFRALLEFTFVGVPRSPPTTGGPLLYPIFPRPPPHPLCTAIRLPQL